MSDRSKIIAVERDYDGRIYVVLDNKDLIDNGPTTIYLPIYSETNKALDNLKFLIGKEVSSHSNIIII